MWPNPPENTWGVYLSDGNLSKRFFCMDSYDSENLLNYTN